MICTWREGVCVCVYVCVLVVTVTSNSDIGAIIGAYFTTKHTHTHTHLYIYSDFVIRRGTTVGLSFLLREEAQSHGRWGYKDTRIGEEERDEATLAILSLSLSLYPLRPLSLYLLLCLYLSIYLFITLFLYPFLSLGLLFLSSSCPLAPLSLIALSFYLSVYSSVTLFFYLCLSVCLCLWGKEMIATTLQAWFVT